jgi:hypothetical protein
MLLQRADTIFASPDWVYEPKRDGFRTLASVRDGAVRLVSRNGHSFTHLFAPVTDGLRGLPMSVLLDGKVIAITDWGLAGLRGAAGPAPAPERNYTGHRRFSSWLRSSMRHLLCVPA